MLHPVWPSVDFWYFLGLYSSLLWLIPSMQMEFIKKTTPLRLTILFSWLGGNTVVSIIFYSLYNNPDTDHFFRDYKWGKTVGFALVLFGNIGLHYYSEKSIACMLTFLFLGFYCLSTLFCIQPFTDFGVLEFFLSASVTQALHLFGLRIYSWLVITAAVVIAGLRYKLEPELLQQPPRDVESGLMANPNSEGEARERIEVVPPRREVELERNRLNVPYLRRRREQNRDRDSTRASDAIDHDSERESNEQKRDRYSKRASDVIDRVSERKKNEQKRDRDSKRASDAIDRVSERKRNE